VGVNTSGAGRVEISNHGGERQQRGGGSNRRLVRVAHTREMKRGATTLNYVKKIERLRTI
jgi:hypothetical protein